MSAFEKLFLAGLALLLLAGCASTRLSGNEGRTFEIVADSTPFYRFGPEQAAGADFTLQRGRLVTLVKRSYGYSEVQLEDGMQGYIATEALSTTPHPESEIFPLVAIETMPEEENSAIVERYYVGTDEDAALPDTSNDTLDLLPPASEETPDFRY